MTTRQCLMYVDKTIQSLFSGIPGPFHLFPDDTLSLSMSFSMSLWPVPTSTAAFKGVDFQRLGPCYVKINMVVKQRQIAYDLTCKIYRKSTELKSNSCQKHRSGVGVSKMGGVPKVVNFQVYDR